MMNYFAANDNYFQRTQKNKKIQKYINEIKK